MCIFLRRNREMMCFAGILGRAAVVTVSALDVLRPTGFGSREAGRRGHGAARRVEAYASLIVLERKEGTSHEYGSWHQKGPQV